MDIQFAFGNPIKSGRKQKRLAKRKKRSKLKIVRHVSKKSSTRGPVLAKRKRSKHRKVVHAKRHKRKKNPVLIYKKKSERTGKMMTDRVGKVMTAKQEARTKKAYGSAKRRAEAAVTAKKPKAYKKARKQMVKLGSKLAKHKKVEDRWLRELDARREDGWVGDVLPDKKKKGKAKKKKSKAKKRVGSKKGAKYVAKRKKRKSKASKKHVKRSKKSKRAKSKSKHHKGAKRKSSKRRRRAKTYAHRHSRKIAHVKKGTSFSGKVYSRGKGRRRHKASVRFKFINPLGGAKMDQFAREWLGHDVKDAGSLLVGGALYSTVNALATKVLNMVSPAIVQNTMKVPVVGPALVPVLVGALLNKYGKKVPGAQFVGEGIVAAAIVGVGVSAGQKVLPAGLLSGVFYTPMSGVPQLGAVKYFPGMSGIPQLAGVPQLGKDPDFGKDVDYDGSGGYTEGHKFSRSDFGAVKYFPGMSGSEDEDQDANAEQVNNMAGMG